MWNSSSKVWNNWNNWKSSKLQKMSIKSFVATTIKKKYIKLVHLQRSYFTIWSWSQMFPLKFKITRTGEHLFCIEKYLMHFWFHKYVNGEPTILPEAKTQKSYNYTKITLQTLVHNFKQDLYNNIFCINDFVDFRILTSHKIHKQTCENKSLTLVISRLFLGNDPFTNLV